MPAKKPRLSDDEAVVQFMNALDHPLKAEMEMLRKIIKGADSRIAERIKWNAPSYYWMEDFLTFNPRAQEHVHLIFHHPSIESISSPMLEGDYKGRRMSYFTDMKEIREKQDELVRVIQATLRFIDQGK